VGQDLEPIYQRDKQAGIITKEEAKYALKMFFIKLQEIGYYLGQDFAKANSSDMGQTINIGGFTSDGRDATAEMDYLLLETQTELKNIQPTFALMYHDNLKQDFLTKAVDLVRTGVGQPQFMNANLVVQRSLDQFGPAGATLAEARRSAVAGCVATSIAGKTASTIESTMCVAKAFELALYDGKDPLTGRQIGPKTGAAESFATSEELFAAFRKQLDFGVTISRDHGRIGCMLAEEFLPLPLRSSFTGGCIERGKDCWAGGADYVAPVYIFNGAVDTANSFAAVKKLVFDDKKLTMAELKKALEANFVGHERVQKMCLDAPKHGNDDDEMTALVRRVYDNMLESYNQTGPCYLGKKGKADCYSKSLHNLNGAVMGALPNGREARRALTDGSVSAMPGSDRNGPTALANSAAQAEDAVAFTSNHLNMKFHPSALEGGTGARNLISLVKGYMDKGGSHVQFNCVNAETLKDAQLHPEKHRDLVVRVAGFSAYFTTLDKGVQDEIVRRTEHKFH
jgi:formate C-acetyltransferase